MRLLLLLSSLFLYLFAPDKYNYAYILLVFCVFIINGYISIKSDIKNKEYISFSVLFLFSFFLTSFAYSIFLKPAGIDIMYLHIINENVITKSTALCQLAFSSYVLGLGLKRKKKISYEHKIVKAHPLNYIITPIIGFIFFIAGYFIVTSRGDTINFDVGWSAFMFMLFILYPSIVIAYSGEKSVLYDKKIFLLIMLTIPAFLLLFIIGDRGLIMMIGISLFSLYIYYIKKIKFIYIMLFSIISILLFSIIAEVRTEGDVLKGIQGYQVGKVDSKWDHLSDLTSISRNLYVGYEYKEKYGLYKPERIFLLAISPIPFLPSLISNNLLNDEYSSYSSTAKIITQQTSFIKQGHSLSGGAGTHAVIDVYMSWGLLGTIIMFLLLGYIVNLSHKNSRKNIYYACVYFGLTAYSISMPRGSLFSAYRLVILLMLLSYLLRFYTFRKVKLNK